MTPEEKKTNEETLKHIEQVRELMKIIIFALLSRMASHDKSKTEAPELSRFCRVYIKVGSSNLRKRGIQTNSKGHVSVY